jgi:hypothetical protein
MTSKLSSVSIHQTKQGNQAKFSVIVPRALVFLCTVHCFQLYMGLIILFPSAQVQGTFQIGRTR